MIIERIEQKNYHAIKPMRGFLDHMPLPERLTDLYENLLSQGSSNDSENKELSISALSILTIATRSLSVLEVAWAVQPAVASGNVDTVQAVARRVDHQRIMT